MRTLFLKLVKSLLYNYWIVLTLPCQEGTLAGGDFARTRQNTTACLLTTKYSFSILETGEFDEQFSANSP
jgi:hypothetical protein